TLARKPLRATWKLEISSAIIGERTLRITSCCCRTARAAAARSAWLGLEPVAASRLATTRLTGGVVSWIITWASSSGLFARPVVLPPSTDLGLYPLLLSWAAAGSIPINSDTAARRTIVLRAICTSLLTSSDLQVTRTRIVPRGQSTHKRARRAAEPYQMIREAAHPGRPEAAAGSNEERGELVGDPVGVSPHHLMLCVRNLDDLRASDHGGEFVLPRRRHQPIPTGYHDQGLHVQILDPLPGVEPGEGEGRLGGSVRVAPVSLLPEPTGVSPLDRPCPE